MKKIIIVLFVAIFVLTGCQQDVLVDFIVAHDKAGEAKTGNMNFNVVADMTYNEEGMTAEELAVLSYFDRIELSYDNVYDYRNDGNKSIGNIYYNLGGMGFDMTIYSTGDENFIKIPIMNGYMKVENMTGFNDEEAIDYEAYGQMYKELFTQWKAILEQENIIKGNKTYITTDEGQIKATTYEVTINEEQFELLKSAFNEAILENESLIEQSIRSQIIIQEDAEITKDEVVNKGLDFFERLKFKACEGKAYVDFDGRLVKEEMHLKLELLEAKKGEPKEMVIDYDITFSHLDEDVELDFPEVTEDMWIDMGQLEEFSKTLPMVQ